MKLKVLLAHLANPVIVEAEYHHGLTYYPLQAGYLKAAARAAGLLSRVDIDILDRDGAYLSGDAALIDAIAARRPDVIGFTLYNCSSERSLYVAGEIRKRLPAVTVIVGGPDVSLGHAYVVNSPAVDIGCVGEGEHAFVEILGNLLERRRDHSNIKGIFFRRGGTAVATPPRPPVRDLSRIPSPILSGDIPVKDYTCHFLMASRGCWSRCSYCGQGSRAWAHFPVERVLREIACLKRAGARYITFFDSNFIGNRFYRDLLAGIARLNKDKSLIFSCFVYADRVDEEFAGMLKDANFTDIQAGLQSCNVPTLRAIGREHDDKRFLEGIEALRDRGIAPAGVDLITGLPKDTPASFKKTIRFLGENGIRPNIYRLQVYPGTKLDRDAAGFGIEKHGRPPYFVKRTASFTRRELDAADRLEHFPGPARYFNFSSYCRCGFSSARPKVRCLSETPGRINKLIVDVDHRRQTAAEMASWGARLGGSVSQQLTLWFRTSGPVKDFPLIEAFVRHVRKANPHGNLKILFEAAKPLPEGPAKKLIAEILDGLPPGFGRHLFCHLVPWDARTKAPAGGPGTVPRCLAVDIPPGPRSREVVEAAFGANGFSEIVFDFAPGCGRDTVVPALKLIAERSGARGMPASFRNLAFNRCGAVPVSADKIFAGTAAVLDGSMRLHAVFEAGRRLDLDLLSFRLTVKKALS